MAKQAFIHCKSVAQIEVEETIVNVGIKFHGTWVVTREVFFACATGIQHCVKVAVTILAIQYFG